MHQISLEGVEVSYPNAKGRHVVLQDLDLNISAGNFVSLVGPSGCGKSTILRMIFGTQFPVAGQVLFEGRPVEHVGRDRGIVYQKYTLFPHVSVRKNIMLGILLEETNLPQRMLWTPAFRKVRASARNKAEAMLTEIGLKPEDGDKLPYELSGGMQQRVAIAQAIIMQPKVLLMDEPFSGLDDNTRRSMQDLLHKLWKAHGLTVVFVTHNLEEAIFLANRVVAVSQFWSGEDGERGQGARIVYDCPVPEDIDRHGAEMREMLAHIRADALDENRRQTPGEFKLTHQDAVRPKEVAYV